MRDLNKYYKLAKAELDVLDIPYSKNIVSVTPNSRATKRWGQCKRRGYKYYINISTRLLDESVPEKSLMTVLIHELLHSCPNCMEHKNEWKRLAEMVNDCYNYNISRCNSSKEYGVKPLPKKKPKYTVTCTECGQKYYHNRKAFWFDNPSKYAKCGVCHKSSLIIIQNR